MSKATITFEDDGERVEVTFDWGDGLNEDSAAHQEAAKAFEFVAERISSVLKESGQ